MENQKKSDDIVSSIFSRLSKKKELSSIFKFHKKTPAQEPSSAPDISKQPLSRKVSRQRLLPIGIDIGANSIKIAQLSLIDNKCQVSKLAIKEFHPELIDDQNKLLQLLPTVLRQILEENNLKGDAYSAVSLDIAQIKNVSIPKMPRAEIDSTVKWEIQQTDKTNINELCFDYVILDEDKMSQLEKIELLIVTSPKSKILKHLTLLESVGLNVLAVEVEPLSLIACLDYNHSINPDEVILLLDFGAGSTKLNIVVNNELHFTRVLNVNGSSLTTAIKEYCHVSYQEAEELKRKYGLAAPAQLSSSQEKPEVAQSQPEIAELAQKSKEVDRPTQVKNAISIPLEKLAADIEHTFKHFSYQLTKSTITTYNKVILSGGSANLKMLTSFLNSRMNVPVEIANPLSSLEISQEVASKISNLEQEAVRFGVAIGLALRGIEQG